ncbi:MAG TPA: amidase [Bryobacteraceae bacterium]|nr:amidase [Bryobacteraceae bacterium]
MTILEAARLLRAKKASSLELVEDSLRRIAEQNSRFNAFLTVMAESAREAAGRADAELARGRDRGPLHGVPVAVKDVYATAGVRTTAGSKLFSEYVPDHDAAVVERLAAAGAVLVGKTNMHELAYGITSNNPHFGAVRNPRDPERIPGGSSGGSGAAVAADMVPAAMGSDTGGSIRIPASFCGVVGLKPTYGRVSRFGVLPLDFSLDHMGPLTRTVRDAAVVLNAIAGQDPRDDSSSARPVEDYLPPLNPSLAGVRIGVPENFGFDRVSPAVADAVRAAIVRAEQLGARVSVVRVTDMEAVNAIGRVILLAEASALFGERLSERESFGADVFALLEQGRLLPATDYVNAQRLRRLKRDEFRSVWREVDFLVTPTTPTTAPRIGETTVAFGGTREDVRLASTRLVRGINVLGLPAISLPCGADSSGLPVGMQVIAPEFGEAGLLRVAAAFEQALGGEA